MNSLRNMVVLSTLFLFVGSFLFVNTAEASTCYCYFGEENNCSEVYVAPNATTFSCQKKCEEIFSSGLRSANFAEGDAFGEQVEISLNCAEARKKVAENSSRGGVVVLPTTHALFTKPELNVEIPTVLFTTPFQKDGLIISNIYAEYVTGVYSYLLIIATVLATVMIMIGGLQYAFGAVSKEQIGKAKKRITNGITGLVLLLMAYSILYLVNPNLTLLQTPLLEYITPVDVFDAGDPAFEGKALCNSIKECQDWCNNHTNENTWPTSTSVMISPSQTELVPTISGLLGTGSRVTPEVNLMLLEASKVAQRKDPSLAIRTVNGYRALADQIKPVCNSVKNGSETFLKRIGNGYAFPGSSKHGTGKAVDVLLYRGTNAITTTRPAEQNNKDSWESNASLLAEIMGEAGFYRLNIEMWHFESEGGGSHLCKGSGCTYPPIRK